MAWAGRDRRAAQGRARHRWDELLPRVGPEPPGLLELSGPLDPSAAGMEPDDPLEPSEALEAIAPETEHAEGPAAERVDAERVPSTRRIMVSARVLIVLTVVLAVSGAGWWIAVQTASPTVHSVRSGRGAAASDSTGQGGDDASAASEAPLSPSAPAAGGDVLVHVAGAVAAPGVIRLPRGARVHEAIAAAGGAAPDADIHRLNLAAVVDDGSRLHVPRLGEPQDSAAGTGTGAGGGAGGSKSSPGGAGTPSAKVNINQATVEELGALPRVGPVLAQRIVDYRTAHGRFSAPEDLDAVDGIGPKMLEALVPLVSVG
jgi:competence protein ComEA